MKKSLRILWLLLLFSTLFLQTPLSMSVTSHSDKESQDQSNNIAIATVGNSVNSEISTIAGRAPYYLIFNENGVYLKSVKNPALSRGRSASSGVIDLLLKESCKIVIAGQFGDKMQYQLKANKIEYYQRKGIADNVLQTFIKSKSGGNKQ